MVAANSPSFRFFAGAFDLNLLNLEKRGDPDRC
jgi:hypothetical protein